MPRPRGLASRCAIRRAFGGQAGASARIENYLGFPTGISGLALTARAYNQAQKFGAEMMIPVEVTSLDCSRDDGAFGLKLDDGEVLRARSVVVASGARYRRPEIANLADFEGRGVWYWASPIEARLCVEQEVVLVGGGNSAGQAAVFLSGHASKVHMVIRGGGLGASMSRYLIERIEAASNIELVFNTEVVGLEGTAEASLERVRWRSRLSGEESSIDIRNLFLFVGADPATGWLDGCGVTVDRGRFCGDRGLGRKQWRATGIRAGNLGARRIRGRRCAFGIGQAGRRRDRRGRAGGGCAARISRRYCQACTLTFTGRGETQMAELVVMYKTPKDTAAFDKYYFEKHIPIAKKIPGLRKYMVSQGPVATPAGLSPFHLIATLTFDNLGGDSSGLRQPRGQGCGG